MGQFAYTVISKTECLLKQFGLSASLKGTTVDAEQPVVNLQVSTPLAYPPDHATLPVLWLIISAICHFVIHLVVIAPQKCPFPPL